MLTSNRVAACLASFLTLTSLPAFTGCGSDRLTNPDTSVYVTVAPTWITGAAATVGGDPGVRFSIDATIHNGAASDIQFVLPTCSLPLEHLTSNGWAPAVAGGFCAMVATAPIVVPAHTTRVQHIDVAERLAGVPLADVPRWTSTSAAGIYRAHFNLTTTGPALTLLPESESASPPFTIFD